MPSIAMLGSGEFEPWCDPVERWCLERAPSRRVLVLPTASAPEGEDVFGRWASMGLDHYRRLGFEPEVLAVRTRDDACDPANAGAVADAGMLFFSGGNPGYVSDALRDTPLWTAIVSAVANGTAIGGCSAGAVMLGVKAPFVADEMLSHWVPGLGLLGRAYLAPHFDMLDTYMPGLRDLFVRSRPEGALVVGIDENTALFGDDEDGWTVCGSGAVWVGEGEDPSSLQRYGDGERVPHTLGVRLA